MRRTFFVILFSIGCINGNLYAQLEKTRLILSEGMNDPLLKVKVEANVSTFFEACNKAVMDGKKPDLASEYFTKEGKLQLSTLWKSGAMAFSLSEITEKCIARQSGGFQIRNIPVKLMDAPVDRQDNELVVNLTNEGKIEGVYIAIEEQRYLDLLSSTVSVADFNRRQVVIDFVENFRTAYNLKDMKYLEKVFSDKALIIVGRVIKEVNSPEKTFKAINPEKVVYRVQTKQQYMLGLKQTFTRNKYIDVKFSEVKILRHPQHEKIYGVTLKQDWGSSTYNDTGYVFLAIDFRDENQPLIHVRTWQPAEYNNKPIPRDEIFKVTDFNFQNNL